MFRSFMPLHLLHKSWNVYHYLKIKRVYWGSGRMEQLFY